MQSLSRTLRIAAALAFVSAGFGAFHRSSDPAVLDRYSTSYAALLAVTVAGGVFFFVLSRPSWAARLHAMRVQLVLVGVTSAMMLISLEVIVRLADPLGISYYELGYRYTSDKLADARLAYRHRRDHAGDYAGWHLETNSLGFRDREIAPDPAPGEVRILLLGDSVALGMGVRREHTFARLLEDRLGERIGGPVEVINTGVGSYNTQQQLMVLEEVGLGLSPDALVLVFVNNDIDPIPHGFDPSDILGASGRNWLGRVEIAAGRSWLYRLIAHVGRVAVRPMVSEPPDWWSTGVVPGWDRVRTALGGIQSHARELGIPFVVVHWRNTRSPEDEHLQRHLEQASARHGFAVVDALPWFEPHRRHEYLRSAVDSHPNAFGHRLTAEGIDRALLDLGVVEMLQRERLQRETLQRKTSDETPNEAS